MSTIPNHVQFVNTVSSGVFDCGLIFAAGTSALVGLANGKPLTYALQSVGTNLFWKYVHPNTIEKIFMHEHSNTSSRLIGGTLSLAGSILIPYWALSYVVLPNIDENTPLIGRLKRENNQQNSYTILQAVAGSIPATLIRIATQTTTIVLSILDLVFLKQLAR